MSNDQQHIIDILKNLLASARAGDVAALAVATVGVDQRTSQTVYCMADNAARLHYACAYLTHRVLMEGTQEDE